LYELLTSLTVVSALTTGTVAMQPLLERERLTTDVNILLTHLSLARSEAIRRATPVTLCKSATGYTCTPDSHWEQGWIVFVDADEDEEVGADETIIRAQQPLSAGHTMNLQAALGRNDALTYHPSGQSARNGTFTLCGRQHTAKTVILNRIGRARVSDRTTSGAKPRCR
jgi:type IV fimbrial biogenesis protein FimT